MGPAEVHPASRFCTFPTNRTRKLAETPTRFLVERMPKASYLVIPEVFSERRAFIPIGFESPETMASNLVKIVPEATPYHFGMLSSTMHMTAIEKEAQGVLDARAKFPKSSLADLYDPLSMPPELTRAHEALDRAVDAAYGRKTFKSDAERIAFLFERYQEYTSLLPVKGTKRGSKVRAK